VPPAEDFAGMVDDLAGSPWLAEVGAVITGYFGDPRQIEPVARLIEAVKRANPQALYLLDPVTGDGNPVTGDGGRLYQPEATLAGIRDRLMPLADIATPNRFELEFLTGMEFTSNAHLIEAASALGPAIVVVTSAFPLLKGGIGNLMVDGYQALLAEHREIANVPKGLGDLTGAVFLARMLSGATSEKALQTATAAVYEILARTTKRGADELTLETDAESLKHPMAMVQMRRLVLPSSDRRA
jgi:pyridoxine kinase